MDNVFYISLVFLTAVSIAGAHNITEILSAFPEYSQFNDYLTKTKLDDEINSRQTITVLVLNNSAMSSLIANHPLSVIKSALSLHVLLDYFDNSKLHQISDGTTISTTLLQTTGNAPGQVGFVNITDLKGGMIGFGSAVPGSPLDSIYTKSVKQIPYNLSVIQINPPIMSKAILDASAPSPSDVNITDLLEKAGCKTFASLISSSGVVKQYQSAVDEGLTLFAPKDGAFKADGVPDLSKLNNADLVALLQYHALPSYTPKGSLKTTKGPITTLATNGTGKFELSVTTAGDSITLKSGIGSSRVSSTVIDSTPLCIFSVDNVLLPSELFSQSLSPAPGPSREISPSPAPGPSREISPSPAPEPAREISPLPAPGPVRETSPSPAPAVASPASETAQVPSPFLSPPAPPMSSPAGSPADAPGAESQSSKSNNAAGIVEVMALLTTFAAVSASVIVSVLM